MFVKEREMECDVCVRERERVCVYEKLSVRQCKCMRFMENGVFMKGRREREKERKEREREKESER